jgi:hypothetical protein
VEGCYLNGGKNSWDYDSRTNAVQMVSMNGADVTEFMKIARQLVVYTMEDTDSQLTGKWAVVIEEWKQVQLYFGARTLTSADVRAEAIAATKHFVVSFSQASGAAGITYYLHTLYDHTEWFFCTDSDNQQLSVVSWWSAQAVEANHSIGRECFAATPGMVWPSSGGSMLMGR